MRPHPIHRERNWLLLGKLCEGLCKTNPILLIAVNFTLNLAPQKNLKPFQKKNLIKGTERWSNNNNSRLQFIFWIFSSSFFLQLALFLGCGWSALKWYDPNRCICSKWKVRHDCISKNVCNRHWIDTALVIGSGYPGAASFKTHLGNEKKKIYATRILCWPKERFGLSLLRGG